MCQSTVSACMLPSIFSGAVYGLAVTCVLHNAGVVVFSSLLSARVCALVMHVLHHNSSHWCHHRYYSTG